MIRRALIVAAFFSPLRVAKFLGFCGGKHRARPDRPVVLFAAAAGVVVVSTVCLMALLNLAPFAEVPR